MNTTIELLKKKYDFPAMFARCGNPIITVIPLTGGQPGFSSYTPDGIDTTMDYWEMAMTIASAGDSELEAEAKERLRQIRLDLEQVLAVFNPQTHRMIIKLDIYHFELCIEKAPQPDGSG
jgi:hypothetical protein